VRIKKYLAAEAIWWVKRQVSVMVRERNRLSDTAVKAKENRGLYSDGGGLYLQITKLGYRSWVYRFRIHRKLRTMGLGAYPAVTLSRRASSATTHHASSATTISIRS
jgi:hypothetical protein